MTKQTGTTPQYLVLGGGLLVGNALFGVGAWVHTDGDPTWTDLQELGVNHQIAGFMGLYFAALGYLVLAVTVFLGVLSTVPTRFRLGCQVAGVAAGLGAIALALAGAAHKVGTDGIPRELGLGAYLTLGGYLVIIAGCVLGTWRPARRGVGADPALTLQPFAR